MIWGGDGGGEEEPDAGPAQDALGEDELVEFCAEAGHHNCEDVADAGGIYDLGIGCQRGIGGKR